MVLWSPGNLQSDWHLHYVVLFRKISENKISVSENTNHFSRIHKSTSRTTPMKTRSTFFIVLLFVSLFWLNFAVAETIHIPVSRDLWVSSVAGEEEGNNGKASRLKLKSYQEFSIIDFDLAKLKGRNIDKATLHIKLVDNQRLRRVGVSTLSAEWVEGSGSSYTKEHGSSSFRWQKNPDTPWVAGLNYSDLTLVMFDAGGTFWSHAEASEPNDNWQTIDIAPRIIAARVAGISYGFVLFDDTGTELYRESESSDKTVFNNLPNRFFYSKDQNASVAPYLVVECSDAKPAKPPKPQKLKVETKDLPPGEAVISWEIPPLEKNDVLGFFVSANGKELQRSMIPVPDFSQREKLQTLTLRLRSPDLIGGDKVNAEVYAVNNIGEVSPPAKITFNVSDAVPSKLSGKIPQPFTIADDDMNQLPKLGKASISIIDELDKVTEKGKLLPPQSDSYFVANHLWKAGKTPQIRLAAARNEFIAFQIHMVGNANGVKPSIRWTKENNNTPTTSYYRFEYIETPIGKIADPMPPLEGKGLDVQERDTIYCEMFVPKDIQAGTHSGVLTLQSGSDSLEMAISLSVWNFTIPDRLGFLPEMNCYSLPSNERDYYRLAQLHRTYINRVPYSHRGTVDTNCAPVWNAGTKTFDWAAWDNRYAQYFDGSAFADLPRGAVPIEAFYLPLHENFPADIFKHYRSKNDGNDWADEVLGKEYAEEFKAGCREFAQHFKTKKWQDTCFHFYLNNKMNYKDDGWSRASSPWLLDEPASYRDFAALRYFGELFHEATASIETSICFRCDISRPQWQRNSLEGLMGVNVVGGDVFRRFNRLVNERKERNGEFMYTYGTTCRPEEGAVQPAAWSLYAWFNGADGIVPWQTIGTKESWKKSDELALFYPAREGTPPVVASQRLKSYRRGQQDVEYLLALQRKMNCPRWDVTQAVQKELGLSGTQHSQYAEDAGTLRFKDATPLKLWQLRMRVGNYVHNGNQ